MRLTNEGGQAVIGPVAVDRTQGTRAASAASFAQTGRKPGTHDCVGRQDPPVLTVERDRDAVSALRPKRRHADHLAGRRDLLRAPRLP